MKEISTQLIKELRQKTGVGIMEAKHALIENRGDLKEAVVYLKERGKKIIEAKADRATNQGVVDAYIHSNKKVTGVVVLLCETDFVARTEDFQNLAHELAMQVAATKPKYLSPEDVSAEILEKEKDEYRAQVKGKKPKEIIEKIVMGKLEKYFEENCLLNQRYIKDDTLTVDDLVKQKVSSLGENIRIKSFVYLEI
ncbi:MAG: elongation factor Ts [Patescibacteria group bacterium]|nr:elongation factor Ts [Patescibacteria group bacterium]